MTIRRHMTKRDPAQYLYKPVHRISAVCMGDDGLWGGVLEYYVRRGKHSAEGKWELVWRVSGKHTDASVYDTLEQYAMSDLLSRKRHRLQLCISYE